MADEFGEFYRRHPVYAAFPQEHVQAGSIPLHFIRSRKSGFEADDPAMDAFVLGVSLMPTLPELEVDFGEGLRRFHQGHNQVYLTPTSTGARYRADGFNDLLFLATPYDSLAEFMKIEKAELVSALRPLHDLPLADALSHSLSLEMWGAVSRMGPAANLFVDQAMNLLVLRLLLAARGAGWLVDVADGGAAPLGRYVSEPPASIADGRLGRVIDYVEAYIDNGLTIDELAGIAHYSPHHFCRAFKSAVGTTPHRYVMKRRLERAKVLIAAQHDIDLTSVALACGFASHSHMTEVFQRHEKMAPGAWRHRMSR